MIEPSKRYDHLVTSSDRREVPPDEFESIADSEPATSGWVVLCLAFDDDGRILLVEQPWADGWMLPGGARKNGESLSETAAREVQEETGVVVSPTRPHWVHDHTVENVETGEVTGWKNVYFGATVEAGEIRDDVEL